LNLGPFAYQATALPTELQPQVKKNIKVYFYIVSERSGWKLLLTAVHEKQVTTISLFTCVLPQVASTIANKCQKCKASGTSKGDKNMSPCVQRY
jgi:hypothetical protein